MFDGVTLQGFMKKKTTNNSIFAKGYLKRYFTIDFGNAMIFVKDSEEILFRDVLRCYLPQFGMENQLKK